MKLKIAPYFGAGLMALALAPSARAAYIVGDVDFTSLNGASLLKADNTSVGAGDSFIGTAKKVDFSTATVTYADGAFTGLGFTPVTFNLDPWAFDPLTTGALWTIGPVGNSFTFNVQGVTITGGVDDLTLAGVGIMTSDNAAYQASSGNWTMTIQRAVSSSPRTSFSWSSSGASVPDGGATVALLGISILGLHGVRRKLATR